MWLLVLAGILAVSVSAENVQTPATAGGEKSDDLVLLEIDLKGPSKRSPVSATAVYGASPSQYVIRHGDESQELTPEYLGLLQQYTNTQPQPAAGSQRPGLSGYTKQQQQLQQAYQNSRVPAVNPPRPRPQLHSQALARAEAAAQIQSQIDAQSRAEALHAARGPVAQASYVDPKLGSFEQELFQLVSANQAQEFKLAGGGQPSYALPQGAYPSQDGGREAYQQLPEQYHVETTSGGRYNQQAYQPAEAAQAQYQAPQQYQQNKVAKPFRPAPRYQVDHQAVAQAQADAQSQALAFQKIAQASHSKHQQAALEQIRANNELHRQNAALEEIRVRNEQQRQTTALEQIRHGEQVSEAGRAQLEERAHPRPVDPEAQVRAQLKAQAAAEAAAARRAQEAAEYKAHADAIRNLEAQQEAHVRAQEEAHKNALALERNQLRAQANAQALANAQAEAIYKHQQQARAKAQSEAQAAARAQNDARKLDPNAPVIQYLIPNNVPLPSPNSYFTNEQIQKFATSASSYAPRVTSKEAAQAKEQAYLQQAGATSQSQKYKSQPQSSIYVAQSGLQKKAPVKSLTIEEIIEQDQQGSPQVVRLPNLNGPQSLTQEDVAALINAGYSVTPVPPAKPAQRPYVGENSQIGYYQKKQRSPVRGEYSAYEDDQATLQRRPVRKERLHQPQVDVNGEASEKILYVVPFEEGTDAQVPREENRPANSSEE